VQRLQLFGERMEYDEMMLSLRNEIWSAFFVCVNESIV